MHIIEKKTKNNEKIICKYKNTNRTKVISTTTRLRTTINA